MKFNSIKINKEITLRKGISEIDINRLSNVVALVGKNGSGKTRILDLLEDDLLSESTILDYPDKSINGIPKYIYENIIALKPISTFLSRNLKINDLNSLLIKDPNNSILIKEIQTLRNIPSPRQSNIYNNLIQNHYNPIKDKLSGLKHKYVRRIKNIEIQNLQNIINANTTKDDVTFENLIEKLSEDINYNEFSSINKTALSYLAKLPHQLVYDYTDTFGDVKKYETRVSHKRFIALKKLIKDFLNKELTWNKKSGSNTLTENGIQSTFSGIWKLDNREFNYLEFSDGEKTLFAYALLLFLINQNPNLNIKECIIIVDEPELHLHPNSEINLINALRNAVGENGQLIFATHSLSILSSLNYDEIFMVKDGVIKHPSNSTLKESLAELMGIEDRVNKLSDFLSSISTWTFVNFMAECFSKPETIESARPNDPQIIAFKEAIINNLNSTSNLLLDFGAGKGRLYEQIKQDYDFINKINYSALEPSTKFHETLKTLGVKNVFESHKMLPKDSFNFILLCNVLHEIKINEWIHCLNSIIDALKDDGFLIIIEAKVLTKGEKIGEEGFILLDLPEMKILFGLEDLPSSISNIQDKEKITSAVISKKIIKQVTKLSLENTLKALEENTLKKIISIRNENKNSTEINPGQGRKNAFLSQLHINSKLAQLKLKVLDSKSASKNTVAQVVSN